ncbi:MAG: Hpt domain-containing protein [bacterium]|nr:Hpt domain-containing protein [bacterium]
MAERGFVGDNHAPLDLARFLEITDNEPEMTLELIEAYTADTSDRVRQLREALSAGDAPRVRDLAHTVKGSSGNIGALGMQAIALELEDLAKAGVLDGAPAILERLQAEYVLVCGALQAQRP